MTQAERVVHFVAVCGALAWATVSRESDGDLTKILLREGPEPEVRFASGKTVYVEALVEG